MWMCDGGLYARRARPAMAASDGISLAGASGVLVSTDGQPFSLKGISWEGAETTAGAPGGLNANALSFYFSFLRRHKFNTVRIPFNHKNVRDNAAIPTQSISRTLNSELFANLTTGEGVVYIEMLRQVVLAAARENMLVVLAAGRLTPTSWPGDGLWYSREIPEAVLPVLWTKLADALCGQWNVVGVDLHQGAPLHYHGSRTFARTFAQPTLCACWLLGRTPQSHVGTRRCQSSMG